MIREAAFWVACVITFGSLVVNNTPLLPTCLGKEKMGHNHNKLCSCFKECSDRSRIIQVFVCFKAFLQNLCVRHTDTENQMEHKHNELWKCCYRRSLLSSILSPRCLCIKASLGNIWKDTRTSHKHHKFLGVFR